MRCYLRDPTFSRFDTIPECDGHTHTHTHTHTHRQTDRHTTTAYTALSKASRGKNECGIAGHCKSATAHRSYGSLYNGAITRDCAGRHQQICFDVVTVVAATGIYYCLARSVKLPTGLYILLALISFFFFFNDHSETNYLRIC